MKLAFFFFTLSILLGAYHARHLHVKTAEVIEMVTGEEEPQPPPLPPLSYYGGQNLEGRPSPKPAVPIIETIYGEDNPKAPLPPRVALSQGQNSYGRDIPQAPPPPKVAPSRGQTAYGGAGVAKNRLADFLALPIPSYDETIDGSDYLNAQPSPQGAGSEQEEAPPGNFQALLIPSYDETINSWDYLNAQPSPQGAGDEGQGIAPAAGEEFYDQDNQKAPFSPRVVSSHDKTRYNLDNPNAQLPPPPSRGQMTYGGAGVAKKRLADFLALLISSYDETIYGRDYLNAQPSPQGPGSDQEGAAAGEGAYNRDNPKAPPSPSVDISVVQTTYDRDDLTTPPSLDPNEGGLQARYGQVDPIQAILFESTSTFDGRRNRNSLRAPTFTPDIKIKQNEDQLLSIVSRWLVSYKLHHWNI